MAVLHPKQSRRDELAERASAEHDAQQFGVTRRYPKHVRLDRLLDDVPERSGASYYRVGDSGWRYASDRRGRHCI